jgi:serine/threonine-protein kinase HipA
MDSLYVHYKSKLVGTLKRDKELAFSFEYSNEWLSDPSHFALSLSLRLEKIIYGNKDTLAFFENLLPEADVKIAIEKSQNISGTFDFLKKYGQDCAGAITINASKNLKAQNKKAIELHQINDKLIYKAIDEKRSVAEVIAENIPGYLSIAGAQDKFACIYKDKKFYIPKNGEPTTHIVKMPIFRSNIKESVYNETLCMSLARKIGFSIPEHFILSGKHPLYIIHRYDRVTDIAGLTERVHQQDFCQAQGFTSEFKYEEKNGPTLKNNYDLIVENVSAKNRIPSIHTYLDWISFNLLVGNNDAHSKNISFLMINDRCQIAPFYDLICTAIYPKLSKKFAFKIGDKTDSSLIGQSDFIKLDQQLEIKAGTFQERFQSVHQRIQDTKSELIMELQDSYGDIKIFNQINALINERAKGFKFRKALK